MGHLILLLFASSNPLSGQFPFVRMPMMTLIVAAMVPSTHIQVVHGLDLISSHMSCNLLARCVCSLL